MSKELKISNKIAEIMELRDQIQEDSSKDFREQMFLVGVFTTLEDLAIENKLEEIKEFEKDFNNSMPHRLSKDLLLLIKKNKELVEMNEDEK